MASDSTASKKDDKKATPAATATEQKTEQQPAQKSAALEEDDEFEDFPVDGEPWHPQPPLSVPSYPQAAAFKLDPSPRPAD